MRRAIEADGHLPIEPEEVVRFTIPGTPTPRPAPTPQVARKRNGEIIRDKRGNPIARILSPKDYRRWKKNVANFFRLARPKWTAKKQPVVIEAIFWFAPPEYIRSVKWKLEAARAMVIPHIVKPDRDNLIKGVQDALNGVAFLDDGQVYAGNAAKFYSDFEDELSEITLTFYPEIKRDSYDLARIEQGSFQL